jgi:acyl transferase domain-containing protein
MQGLPGGGAMAAVHAEEACVRAAIEDRRGEVSIAAVNAPQSVVISGAGEAVRAVVADLAAAGVRSQALRVSHAFHSPLMDPVLDALETAAGRVEHRAPRTGLVSNLSGRVVKAGELGASYWRRHAREAVRFADGIRTLKENGYEVLVELGPNPTLLGMGRRCAPGDWGTWLPTLRKGSLAPQGRAAQLPVPARALLDRGYDDRIARAGT